MINKPPYRLTFTVFTFFCTLSLAGQEYKIDPLSVDGGGGTSSGGAFTVTGTIGQSAADKMAGDGYELYSGFQSIALQLITPPDDGSFTEWIDGLPPEDRPPEGLRGPHDQPAADGMTNLLKYFLGLMPLTSSRDAAPQVVVVPKTTDGVDREYLAVEFERSTDALVTFRLEASQDFATWQEAAFSTEILGSGGDDRERVRLVSDIRVGAEGTHFLRLVVETP